MASTTSYDHPEIGTVEASTAQEGVLQFLGVQYATLEHRFAPASVKEYSPGAKIDATKLGPSALAVPNGADFEFGLMQQSLDYDRDAVTMSDTECLNLNITVPVTAGKSPREAKLPVMAFIHGGGFMGGSCRFPQYDMARLVRLSAARGQPMIAVSFNYRLGAPGFLYSTALERAGCKSNNGLRDQRAALLWLKKYIAGFGGNADNVTCLGQSAGAMSTAIHLYSKTPLFKRAALMGGSGMLQPLASLEDAEANYGSAMKALGLTSLGEEEQVQRLIKMDGHELRSQLFAAGVGPKLFVDGDICPTSVDYKSFVDGPLQMPGKEWCESLLIGDCQFDGSIIGLFLMRRKAGIASRFCTAITSTLGSSAASKLLSAYGLSDTTTDDDAFVKVLEYANDLSFYVPTVLYARALSPGMPVHVYRFNEPNTWPGTWQGKSTHIHELTFLVQNFNEKMDEGQKALAEELGGDVVNFINGKEPWKKFEEQEGVAKVMKVGETGVRSDVPEEVGRRGVMLELAKDVGMEALAGAYGRFMAG